MILKTPSRRAILSLVAVLSVFMPVGYRIASKLSLEGDHLEDVALLAILFLVVTVIVFAITGVIVKWCGIRCFVRIRTIARPNRQNGKLQAFASWKAPS